MNNKTAILIFAHSAEFEATQKPFQSSQMLFNALNAQTLKVVEKTGLPYFLSSEKNQTGSTFGERFTNAIQSVYNKGFDNVISIGNDTPHLQTNHILKALHQLAQNDIVLGPSKDGGFYLMGLKKSYFNVETFLKLPWQTTALRQRISKIVTSQNINVLYLEMLSDIDTLSDVKTIIDSFRLISKNIAKLLQLCLCLKKKIIKYFNISIKISPQTLLFNKGSPFLHQYL
ncbi:TIGR04282 family arsenosugar biosynthesis glycosyltransferase [Lacinutrix salivirga]